MEIQRHKKEGIAERWDFFLNERRTRTALSVFLNIDTATLTTIFIHCGYCLYECKIHVTLFLIEHDNRQSIFRYS